MLTYHDICAAVALRINALDGTDAVALQTTYSTRPLTDELFISSIFPFNAIRDAIIETEGKIAGVIGLSANRTLRAYLRGLTDALVSGDAIPTVDSNDIPIIGNLGMVRDATNGKKLTRKPIPLVQNYLNAPGIFLVPLYYYALDGSTIIHTRTGVVAETCSYSASAQTAAFDADEALLLTDSLAEAYENGALATLMRDDEFTQQAGQYANYFTAFLGTLPPAMMEQEAA